MTPHPSTSKPLDPLDASQLTPTPPTFLFTVDECDAFLSYTLFHADPLDRRSIMKKYDVDGDGKLSRVQFCQMCLNELPRALG